MRFEWNLAKAATNLRKHGVDFADAALVLEDSNAATVEDTGAVGEARFVTIGADPRGRILVVVYTCHGSKIRLISARPATRSERKAYEEGIRFQ